MKFYVKMALIFTKVFKKSVVLQEGILNQPSLLLVWVIPKGKTAIERL